MPDNSIDQQFVEYVVKALVSKPEAVQVERTIDEKGVLLELTVDPEDLGRVIGKRGGTAQSLRTLLRALGTKNDARYNLKIVDSDNGAGATRQSRDDRPADDYSNLPSNDNGDDSAAANDAAQADDVDEDTSDTVEKSDSLSEKTRQELADLDDLDI